MNDPDDDRDVGPGQGDAADGAKEPSALMWTLGCIGKVLLVFVVLVALVFGACLMMLSS